MIDDRTLQDMVIQELDWEPKVDPAHLGVIAKSGVVTLTGFVDSFAAKAAAEAAAKRVRGVRAIAEEIEIRLPHDRKQADDEIAERALRILAWSVHVPSDSIQIKVERGVVTLAGEVPYRYQSESAATHVAQLGGVRGVVNLIGLRSEPDSSTRPGSVKSRIQSALLRNAEVDAAGIHVETDGSHVTLSGTVRSWAERRTAEDAAWAAPDVDRVSNNLLVIQPGYE